MKLHKAEILLYAENEEQAAQASEALSGFVQQMREAGRVVTAPKVVEAISRWRDNALVRSRIENHFPKLKR